MCLGQWLAQDSSVVVGGEWSMSRSTTMPSRQLLMFVLFNSGPTLTFYCVHEQRAKKFRQSVQMSWWLEWAQCNLPGPSGVEGDVKVQLGPETSRRLFFFTPFSPSGTDSLSFPQHGAKPQGTKKEKKRRKADLVVETRNKRRKARKGRYWDIKYYQGGVGGLMQAWQGDILKDAWKDKLISQIKNGNQDV